MSLRVRLTLALVTFSLVPLAVSMGVGYYQTRATLISSEQKRLEAIATLKAAQLRARVDDHRRVARQLLGEFANGDGTPDWAARIRAAAPSVDTTTDLCVLDLQGTVRASSRPNLVGQSWSAAPGIAAGRMRTAAVGPHRQGVGLEAVQDAVYMPLYRDGVTVAQLAVVGSPAALRAWLSRDLPPKARAIVTNLDGIGISAWPPDTPADGELVTARSELDPGGAEIAVYVPVAEVMAPLLTLRMLGVGSLLLLAGAAVGLAMMMARRIVTREQTLQNRLIHQEKLAAVGSLAAGVAHEIGNPLASLSSLVQVRLRRATNEAEQSDLRMILDHVDRMNRTLKNLTRAARGSPSGKRLVLLQDLASRAVQLLRHDPRARHVSLIASAEPGVPPLTLDEDTWLQVTMNLLVNALDAVADAHEPRVIVRVATEGQRVVLEVTDTGCGMSPDVLARATDPLFTTKPQGTGLGLHLVAEVVARSNGTMTLDSAVGRGTIVRIVLPTK